MVEWDSVVRWFYKIDQKGQSYSNILIEGFISSCDGLLLIFWLFRDIDMLAKSNVLKKINFQLKSNHTKFIMLKDVYATLTKNPSTEKSKIKLSNEFIF